MGALVGQSVPVGLVPSFCASGDRVLAVVLDDLDEFVVVLAVDEAAGVAEVAGDVDCAVGWLEELPAVGSFGFLVQLVMARTESSTKQVVQRR